ncbi:interferon gamma receptor 1 [Trichomycterus rosablanca]|uniref:interferon gamma receptor 1 n=1 Tax=Trichomycterus rosablanca TaxID=2290929 RepID=UPI002F3595CF
MWGTVGIDLSLFTVLILMSFAAAGPAVYNVSVACDSYGVVVDWKSSGLGPQAEFLLELRENNGGVITINTTSHSYNITDHLGNAAFNHYFVKVKATDDQNDTVFSESQIFTYNPHSTSFLPGPIVCELEFPTVKLLPRDGQLTVSFINPFHLYGHTPALRALDNQYVEYEVNKQKQFCTSDMCESNVSFSEEQEEYCVTLSGHISQTPIKETNPICYRGTLNPEKNATVSDSPLIPVLIAVTCTLLFVVLGMVYLAKKAERKIMKKNLTKFPSFLVNKPTHTPVVTPLKIEREHVVKNLQVEPAKISPNCDLPESTTLLESPSNEDKFSDFSGEEKPGEELENGELKEQADQDSADPYGYKMELSSGGLSEGYDCPHAKVEISPGDMVAGYGTRPGLF